MEKKIIGLDIGGTKIAGIVFDGKKIIKELVIPTPKNKPEFEHSLQKITEFLSFENNISGAGIGVAGLIEPAAGILEKSPNIRFLDGFNFFEFFRKLGYKHVKLDNDANCFTRAEKVLGQGKDCKNFVAMTLGTGIGGGIVIGGKIYRGEHYGGAEIGKIYMNGKDLEFYYQKYKHKKDFHSLAKILAVQFSSVINILDPELIVLGGGVSQHMSDKFLPQAKKMATKYLMGNKLLARFAVSKLKQPGAVGAALMYFE